MQWDILPPHTNQAGSMRRCQLCGVSSAREANHMNRINLVAVLRSSPLPSHGPSRTYLQPLLNESRPSSGNIDDYASRLPRQAPSFTTPSLTIIPPTPCRTSPKYARTSRLLETVRNVARYETDDISDVGGTPRLENAVSKVGDSLDNHPLPHPTLPSPALPNEIHPPT